MYVYTPSQTIYLWKRGEEKKKQETFYINWEYRDEKNVSQIDKTHLQVCNKDIFWKKKY